MHVEGENEELEGLSICEMEVLANACWRWEWGNVLANVLAHSVNIMEGLGKKWIYC